MTEMMAALRRELMDKSTLGASKYDRLQAMLGVPANANSNQRFLTQEAAKAAGFEVLGLLNEPSAAAVEFAFRNGGDRKNPRKGAGLLVYDLGGGTFDVSLVALEKGSAPSSPRMASPIWAATTSTRFWPCWRLAEAGKPHREGSLTGAEWYLLFDECREKKESLNPNSRKITIDLERVRKEWREVSIGVDAFYERCRPLVESSRRIVEALLAAHPEPPHRYLIRDRRRVGAASRRPRPARDVWTQSAAIRLHAFGHGDRIGHPRRRP